MPVACRCPRGYGQIQTSSQAGGIPSSRMRSTTSGASIRVPSSSRYSKPLPRRRRVIPGPEQSERRSRVIHRTVFPPAIPLGFRTPVPTLEFETTLNGTVAVIAPTGELDLSGAALLEAELDRLAEEPELATVVLDLRGLEFMDSSGLRLVVLADMRARESGRRFVLVKGADTVHRVFEITRMSDRLDFVADAEDVR